MKAHEATGTSNSMPVLIIERNDHTLSPLPGCFNGCKDRAEEHAEDDAEKGEEEEKDPIYVGYAQDAGGRRTGMKGGKER